ncbi:4'-phosphopantetheinyl transferase family protein [Taibaiella helva]|uniref:4'-phosphopantetheinyl transferase family protein n=1 Tax=Taibaiella helva TaxID=2301235 RepID=UPI000E582C4F|nr:4'-phosphopantetheinyl transferase superfamily protein [Taibaiella helva]
MKVHVFYTETSSEVGPEVYTRLLQSFPEKISTKIQKYTGEKERRQRTAGKGLLRYALKKLGRYPAVSLDDYGYTALHQPILINSDIQFSISHSGNLVLCALVEGEGEKVGIDVERLKPVKLELMKFYFDPDAWQEIVNAPDNTLAFYLHWTMREAAIKASGLSLEQMELSAITTEDNTILLRDELYYSRILSLRYDYVVCLASDKEIEAVALTELKMEELL